MLWQDVCHAVLQGDPSNPARVLEAIVTCRPAQIFKSCALGYNSIVPDHRSTEVAAELQTCQLPDSEGEIIAWIQTKRWTGRPALQIRCGVIRWVAQTHAAQPGGLGSLRAVYGHSIWKSDDFDFYLPCLQNTLCLLARRNDAVHYHLPSFWKPADATPSHLVGFFARLDADLALETTDVRLVHSDEDSKT